MWDVSLGLARYGASCYKLGQGSGNRVMSTPNSSRYIRTTELGPRSRTVQVFQPYPELPKELS